LRSQAPATREVRAADHEIREQNGTELAATS
jgi:hypothetical protein